MWEHNVDQEVLYSDEAVTCEKTNTRAILYYMKINELSSFVCKLFLNAVH